MPACEPLGELCCLGATVRCDGLREGGRQDAARFEHPLQAPGRGEGVELLDEGIEQSGGPLELRRAGVSGLGVEGEDDLRQGTGDTRDHAVTDTFEHRRGERAVVADNAAGRDVVGGEVAEDIERAAGILDADDVRYVRDQRANGILFQPGGELWQIVEQHRQRCAGGDGTREGVEIFLRVGEEAGHGQQQALDATAAFPERDCGERNGLCLFPAPPTPQRSSALPVAGVDHGGDKEAEMLWRREAELAGCAVESEP